MKILIVFVFVAHLLLSLPHIANSLTVAIFGGSGYVGRRISQILVEVGCDVISISRSGKPPPYYCNNYTSIEHENDGTSTNDSESDESEKHANNWSDQVSWIRYDMDPKKRQINGEKVDVDVDQSKSKSKSKSNIYQLELPKIDAAISCIGNVNPDQKWEKSTFFGLAFNDDRLYYENGVLNEYAAQMSKKAGAKRFVFISVSYEVAKMLEGPLAGYINGKRKVEHVAYEMFDDKDKDNDGGGGGAIVLGPSLIYGGKRFPKLGDIYRKFVQSSVAKFYVSGNESLRKLSSAPLEDWVEKTIFSPPVKVEVVARVAAAAAIGLVSKDFVSERRQGFFNTDGKPVLYDDVLFIDGTEELERVEKIVTPELMLEAVKERGPRIRSGPAQVVESVKTTYFAQDEESDSKENNDSTNGSDAPYAEGALIGKGPFLFPLPVATFFGTIFYFISSGQFTNN